MIDYRRFVERLRRVMPRWEGRRRRAVDRGERLRPAALAAGALAPGGTPGLTVWATDPDAGAVAGDQAGGLHLWPAARSDDSAWPPTSRIRSSRRRPPTPRRPRT